MANFAVTHPRWQLAKTVTCKLGSTLSSQQLDNGQILVRYTEQSHEHTRTQTVHMYRSIAYIPKGRAYQH